MAANKHFCPTTNTRQLLFIFLSMHLHTDVSINDTQKEERNQRFKDQIVRSHTIYDHRISRWICIHHVRAACFIVFVLWSHSIRS